MSALAAAWQRFWFRPVPVRRVAIYRIAVGLYAFFDIVIVSGFISHYSRTSTQFYKPLRVLGLFGSVLPLSPQATTALHIVLAVALAMVVLGVFTRIALIVAAPLYLWWFATFYSFGAVQHGRIIVIMSLFVLIIAPAGRALSIDAIRMRARRVRAGTGVPAVIEEVDPLAGWALRVVMIMIVAAYTLAAYAKLHTSGLGWATSGALERVIIEKNTSLGIWVSHYPTVVRAMQFLTLCMEATTAVVLFRGRIRDFYFLSLGAFHLGTILLLNINFLGLMIGYLAFYDLEIGADRVGAYVRRVVHVSPVDLVYDSDCGLCVRVISSILSLDWLRAISARPGPPGLSAMRATRRGRTSEGYAAFRETAHVVPALTPTLLLAYLPPVAGLGRRVYGWVASHRSIAGACVVAPDASPAVAIAPQAPASGDTGIGQDRT